VPGWDAAGQEASRRGARAMRRANLGR
jgi:hypothetical protein